MRNFDTKSLRSLEAKATPAPWGKTPFEEKNDVCIWRPDGQWLANVGNWGNCQLIVEGENGPDVMEHPDIERIETGHDANAEFMVAIRNSALAMLDTIDAQAKEIERLRDVANAAFDWFSCATSSKEVALVKAVERFHASNLAEVTK